MCLTRSRNKIFNPVLIFGIGSSIAYQFFVIFGGMINPGYSQLSNTVSQLTAVGEPNAELLQTILNVYYVIYFIFCIALLYCQKNKHMRMGAYILLACGLLSKFGLEYFRYEGDRARFTPSNIAHMLVTVLIVMLYILSFIIITRGFLKKPTHRTFGKYLLMVTVVLAATSLATAILILVDSPILGLVQKIYILLMHLFICSFSIYFTNNCMK